MRSKLMLSLIAVLVMSTFAFAQMTPAPVNPGAKPHAKKMMKGKKMHLNKGGTMESTGKGKK